MTQFQTACSSIFPWQFIFCCRTAYPEVPKPKTTTKKNATHTRSVTKFLGQISIFRSQPPQHRSITHLCLLILLNPTCFTCSLLLKPKQDPSQHNAKPPTCVWPSEHFFFRNGDRKQNSILWPTSIQDPTSSCRGGGQRSNFALCIPAAALACCPLISHFQSFFFLDSFFNISKLVVFCPLTNSFPEFIIYSFVFFSAPPPTCL
jgi:hypothetical protein